MKKILIVGLSMEIGGAERALLGLLNSLTDENYLIDLFLLHQTGELMKYIPDRINILPEIPEYTTLGVPLMEIIRKKYWKHALGRIYAKIKSKIFMKMHPSELSSAVELEYSHKYTKSFMPNISNKEYDLVISFCSPHYFAFEKTKGKKKIAWIHTDYCSISIDVSSEIKMWNKYDYIISISHECTQSFCTIFPSLKYKIKLIENVQSIDFIREQAYSNYVCNEIPILDNGFNLLSIGRFCMAKNFDNIPEICKMIREQGVNVKWYIIGYGGDENLILTKIKEFQMEEFVIILGKKENPYPYIKQCDLYVQPSRYEGKAVAVKEAQILGKPVVITNFKTSKSQLDNKVDGIIVPMDNAGCAKEIVHLLKTPYKLTQLSQNCKMRDYSNRDEIKKIYYFIEEEK